MSLMTITEAALSGVAICCCAFVALALIPLGTATPLVALEEAMDVRLERVSVDLFRSREGSYSKSCGSSGVAPLFFPAACLEGTAEEGTDIGIILGRSAVPSIACEMLVAWKTNFCSGSYGALTTLRFWCILNLECLATVICAMIPRYLCFDAETLLDDYQPSYSCCNSKLTVLSLKKSVAVDGTRGRMPWCSSFHAQRCKPPLLTHLVLFCTDIKYIAAMSK